MMRLVASTGRLRAGLALLLSFWLGAPVVSGTHVLQAISEGVAYAETPHEWTAGDDRPCPIPGHHHHRHAQNCIQCSVAAHGAATPPSSFVPARLAVVRAPQQAPSPVVARASLPGIPSRAPPLYATI
ncbi:MAG: DUF2946 domain-containing protein [Candidatus Dadabacteria bacterium]|nr:MAG: DUF2946 domain-containing protein [Candidatus Dadabacteria bacterium]